MYIYATYLKNRHLNTPSRKEKNEYAHHLRYMIHKRMPLEPCIARLSEYIKHGIALDTVDYEQVISHIELCNSLFEKALEYTKCETRVKGSQKELKCLKCNG